MLLNRFSHVQSINVKEHSFYFVVGSIVLRFIRTIVALAALGVIGLTSITLELRQPALFNETSNFSNSTTTNLPIMHAPFVQFEALLKILRFSDLNK